MLIYSIAMSSSCFNTIITINQDKQLLDQNPDLPLMIRLENRREYEKKCLYCPESAEVGVQGFHATTREARAPQLAQKNDGVLSWRQMEGYFEDD
jgi:hypothetical protein